jgi:outer membrane protein OmpA-like peptidoglycan-associated protein
MRFMKSILTGVLVTGSLMGAASAQSPSSSQIIKALTPTASPEGTTRGIRPAGAPPTASGGAAYAPAAAVNPSLGILVQFATDSADLTPAARATLDQLGRALSSAELSGYKFRIEGHTDTVGTESLNQTLSERRAAAVVDYLVSTYHVDASRLQSVGLGSNDPAVPTGPQVPEPRNRRVQVVNIGP